MSNPNPNDSTPPKSKKRRGRNNFRCKDKPGVCTNEKCSPGSGFLQCPLAGFRPPWDVPWGSLVGVVALLLRGGWIGVKSDCRCNGFGRLSSTPSGTALGSAE